MNLRGEVRLADKRVKKEFNLLSSCAENQWLWNNLNHALGRIRQNPFCGVQVPKKLIPKRYIKNMEHRKAITNLLATLEKERDLTTGVESKKVELEKLQAQKMELQEGYKNRVAVLGKRMKELKPTS